MAMADTMAIVAVHDYPSAWPELLSGLLHAGTSGEGSTSYLVALHYVVKNLAQLKSRPEYNEYDGESEITRLFDEKMAALREFSPSIVMAIVPLWGDMTSRLVTQIGAYVENPESGEPAIDSRLAFDCLSGFRILFNLLIEYMPTLHAYNANFIVNFCTMVASRIETISALVRVTQVYPGSQHVNKLYTKLIKFVVKLQVVHPLTFTPVLLSFLNFFLNEFCNWKDEWRGIQLLETPLIHYMNFISNVLGTQSYTIKYYEEKLSHAPVADVDVEQFTEEAVSTAQSIVTTFFSPYTLNNLLLTIIGRFFKIQEDRLQVWEESPEEFWEEDLTDASFTIRNAAENIYFRLLRYDEEATCSETLKLIQQTRQNCAKENPEEVTMEEILLKEATMSTLAYGYITFSVNELVDYVMMQDEMFDIDMQNPDPRYKVIRRCIAKIIGAWVEDIPNELHKRAWETLIALLADQDPLVKYTALISIKDLLGSIDLDYEPYGSCIRPTMEHTLAFLRASQNSSFAKLILNQLDRLIYHLTDRISPFTTSIVDHVNEFWAIADQRHEQDIKQPIVGILASLCESLPDYRAIYDTLIHVASQTTDLNHPDSVLLLDPGMRLWWNLLQTADEITPELIQLFPRVAYIYSKVPHSANITGMTVRILESYLILGRENVLQGDAITGVATLLEDMVAGSTADLMLPSCDLIITFIQLFPEDCSAIIRPSLARAYQALFYRYPKRTRVVHRTCTLFMHLLLKNPAFFFEFLNDMSLNTRSGQADTEAPLPLIRLVNRMTDVWSYLEYIEPEKVWACGFSALFASQNQSTTQFTPHILDAIAALIIDLKKKTKTPQSRKSATEHSDVITIKGSTVDGLRRKLKQEDISKAHMSTIEEFVVQNVINTLQASGLEFQQEVAAAVEPNTSKWIAEHMGQ
jgi:hypothetical protein